MLVVSPIAFLVGALATDLAFWRTDDHFWALASKWFLAIGMILGALASCIGLETIPVPRLFRLKSFSRRSSLPSSWSPAGGELVLRHRIGIIDGKNQSA